MTGTGQGSGCGARTASQQEPMKGWDDISLEEQVERMRDVVKREQGQRLALDRRLKSVLDALYNHRHGTDEKILVPMTYGPEPVDRGPYVTPKDENPWF